MIMNKRNLLRASFLSALMCISLAYTSCGDDEAVKPIDSTEYVKTSNIVDYVNNSADEVVTVNVDLLGYNHPVVMEELGKIEGKKVKLVIPEGVHKLHLLEEGYNAPETILPALVSVEFPQSINEISLYAFGGCIGLTSVTIPENVVIGKGAFYGCTGLTSVTIPEGVTEIGVAAFYGCTGLTSVTIPESLTEFGKFITMEDDFFNIKNFYSVFPDYDNLETIYCSQAIYDKYHEKYPQMVVKK